MEGNKISVLIADDNKEFCSILNDYLLNQRDIVVTGIAKDGKEALTLIEQKQPDLVILDIIMPHLDGLGVLERLQSMNLEKFPRIVILSAVYDHSKSNYIRSRLLCCKTIRHGYIHKEN